MSVFQNLCFNGYDEHLLNYVNRRKRQEMLCLNCSNKGHIYKTCNHPIISYGIICFKKYIDENNEVSFKYLMVQRKDSLAYVEFIRGKYQIEKKNYILKLFSNMTYCERKKIAENDFTDLWRDMWKKDENEKNRNFNREFNESCTKFNRLKSGYYIRNGDNKIFFNFDHILNNSEPIWNETEWGFPKGRRNINESNRDCAIREFSEETGIDKEWIRMYDIKPFEEIFIGSNKIRYKHVYFLAELNDNLNLNEKSFFDPTNKLQCREVQDVRFFSHSEVLNKIRIINIERRELFKRAYNTICKLSNNHTPVIVI